MKPCPKCGCPYQRFAFAIDPAGTTVALACFNKICDYTGPFVGPIQFPPNRKDGDLAAGAWDAQCVRESLPAFLRSRVPAPNYPPSGMADYVKRAALH